MKRTQPQYENIRSWMYRNARPVDLARWRFHFENGEKEMYCGRYPLIKI